MWQERVKIQGGARLWGWRDKGDIKFVGKGDREEHVGHEGDEDAQVHFEEEGLVGGVGHACDVRLGVGPTNCRRVRWHWWGRILWMMGLKTHMDKVTYSIMRPKCKWA